MPRAATVAWAVFLVAGGCRQEPPTAGGTGAHRKHGHDAGMSGVVSLDVCADGGTVHLLLGFRENGFTRLEYLRSEDGGVTWSSPVRVDRGAPPPHRPVRGNDARIAARGNSVLAVWTASGTGFMGSGPLATAISSDGGRTWRPGPNPADDGSTEGHGFVAVAADEAGRFHLAWLDGRMGQQGLIYARSDDGGRTWTRNLVLDPETCECCWNVLRVHANGVHVLYRDKVPRDMMLVSSLDRGETWTRPTAVGSFGWEFEGCPHVGGGLAIDSEGIIHATVWTAREGSEGIHYLVSDTGPTGWVTRGAASRAEARHSDLAVARGSVALVWDEDGAILASLSADSGRTWTAPRRLPGGGEATASHPRLVSAGSAFVVFWTEHPPDEPLRWRSATLPAPAR